MQQACVRARLSICKSCIPCTATPRHVHRSRAEIVYTVLPSDVDQALMLIGERKHWPALLTIAEYSHRC